MQKESTAATEMRGRIETSPARASLWALIIAALLLVTIVLPAEYGVDWTGVGRVLGLTGMGQQKVAGAKAVATPTVSTASSPSSHAIASQGRLRTDAMDVTLLPNAEVEYKAVLAEGETIVYEWDTGGVPVTFDFHGEPSAGPQGAFLSFQKGSASKGAGTLKAPFAGTHGWYWKNDTAGILVIKLKASGFHSELKRM